MSDGHLSETNQARRLLERLGLLVVPRFLDSDACAALRAEMTSAPAKPATIARDGGVQVVDATVRRLQTRHVSEQTIELVADRFRTLLPRVREHYHVPAAGVERPKFLLYESGDFFKPHADRSDASTIGRDRVVSAVLFLNHEVWSAPAMVESDDEPFTGGTLTFYGLLNQSGFQDLALGAPAEPGLLITFPTSVVHEVKPITSGRRLSVVTWYTTT